MEKLKTMNIFVMTIGFYPHRNWFFYFDKFKNIKGVTIRVFGLEFRILEKDATEKLIAKFRALQE